MNHTHFANVTIWYGKTHPSGGCDSHLRRPGDAFQPPAAHVATGPVGAVDPAIAA